MRFVYGTGNSKVSSDKDTERRRLEDRLIQEHRAANAQARKFAKEAVPRTNARYLSTMDRAMDIINGVS